MKCILYFRRTFILYCDIIHITKKQIRNTCKYVYFGNSLSNPIDVYK
jgi:hypothetical protein